MSKEKFCLPLIERSVLSLLITDIDHYYDAVSKIREKDFLDPINASIFLILEALIRKGAKNFDLPMILEESRHLKLDKVIGGLSYLRAITNMDIDPSNLEVYIKQLLGASTKLHLFNNLNKHLNSITESAEISKDDTEELLSSIEYDILNISSESKSIEEPKNLADGIDQFIQERLEHRVDITGISTGFPILDKMIDGLIPGTLFIVSARLKEGKSALLTRISLNIALQQKIPVLYVDTELTFDEWRTRAIAGVSGVPERSIKHGNLTTDQLFRVNKAVDNIKKAKIFHQYMPGYSVDKLVTLFTKYKLKEDIGAAVFDYIKEPDSTDSDRARKGYQLLGDVTTKLKDLGGKLNIPVLSAVQLNRSGDIADSDRIARYGDVITMWSTRYLDNKEDKKEEFPMGTHKLVVRTTRRGGATSNAGILYQFTKRVLGIGELPAHLQPQDFNKVLEEEQEESLDEGMDGYDKDQELF